MIRFTIWGVPIAQARPRKGRNRKTGEEHWYTPDRTTKWKEAVAIQAASSRPRKPLAGPLSVSLTFYMPRLKKTPVSAVYHVEKPDRDNLDKAVLDALTKAGFWGDDCQIADGRIVKRYVELDGECRVEVEIRELYENCREG